MTASTGTYGPMLRSPIVLTHGDWLCHVVPALGAAVTRLDRGGQAVLRAASADASGPFDLSSFPLVPYANRIADGQVRHGRKTVQLPANLPGQAHPLHGVGFLSRWTVVSQGRQELLLEMAHRGDFSWPWSFSASQHLQLDDDGLLCTLRLTNDAAEAMPAGLGFHPYFPQAATARLKTDVRGVWLTDSANLPTVHQDRPLYDWSGGAAVQQNGLIDHCHTGWDGKARIAWADREWVVDLTASTELDKLHIYAPPEEDFFCLEPVTHRPDAINTQDPISHGLRIVAPGDSMTVWMRIAAGHEPSMRAPAPVVA